MAEARNRNQCRRIRAREVESIRKMSSMTSEDRDFERLKLLFDYTKFHIGLYATLAAALIALLNGDFLGTFRPETSAMWAAIVFIALAGLAGGVIASTVPQRSGAKALYREKAGPWALEFMPGRWWTYVEHTSFWLGIIAVIIAFARGHRTC